MILTMNLLLPWKLLMTGRNLWPYSHTSFSSKLMNGLNKLECFILLDLKGLLGTNTQAYRTHSLAMRCMKCCENNTWISRSKNKDVFIGKDSTTRSPDVHWYRRQFSGLKLNKEIVGAGNTNWRGRLSIVDLLVNIACFVKE